MKRSLSIRKEPNLQRILVISLILHLLFFTIVIISSKTREREFKGYYVNLVGPVELHKKGKTHVKRSARKKIPPKKKRVDKEKTAAAQKTLEAGPKPRADKPPDPNSMIAKEIERLRAIKALSKRRKRSERTQEVEVIRKKVYEASSKVSGTSGKGKYTISDAYYVLVTRKIWSQWAYPDFESTGLEVIISIRIGKDGRVISHEIERSSGNKLFDNSAIKAVSKASPLPPPSVELEIGVRFYL